MKCQLTCHDNWHRYTVLPSAAAPRATPLHVGEGEKSSSITEMHSTGCLTRNSGRMLGGTYCGRWKYKDHPEEREMNDNHLQTNIDPNTLFLLPPTP
jgi:hypothetical protein